MNTKEDLTSSPLFVFKLVIFKILLLYNIPH